MPSRLPPSPDVTEVGVLPSRRVLPAISSTTTPSDSRCAPLDFTTGLYERSLLTRLRRRASPVPNQAVRTCRSPYPGGDPTKGISGTASRSDVLPSP